MLLSGIFSDRMILQRNKPILLKGYARGNQVTVVFGGKVFKTDLLQESYFELKLPGMEAGGPYEMVLYDGERTVISDILIGDVLILGGQSNMELPIVRTMDSSAEEVKKAENPNIRMFQVPKEYSFQGPEQLLEGGSWIGSNPKSIMEFSAVGYFLAAGLYEEYQVPIGLVHTAVGGTPIEAWMSEKALLESGFWRKKIERNKNREWVEAVIRSDAERMADWHKTLRQRDRGIAGKWYEKGKEEFFTKSCTIPGMWENTELEGYKGSVWFMKEFEAPDHWKEKEVLLRLGAIIDGDETYVNGVLAGHTDYRYPPRTYLLPPGLLREGKNTVTIRVFSDAQPGGFMPGKRYGLEAEGKFLSLEGEWKYREGARKERLTPQTFFQYEPAGVYNKMIAPLSDLGICGIAYYQGESDVNEPQGYADKMEAMIRAWREVFHQGEVPFLYVQLACFTDGKKEADPNWEKLRQEQEKALRVKNTAMVDAFDLGEYNDLHPQNKKELGKRLSVAARKLIYGAEIEKSILTMHKVKFHREENVANESSTADKTGRD